MNEYPNETTPEPPEEQPRERVRVRIPEKKPIVTWIVISISIIIYLIQFLTESFTGTDLPLVWGAKFRPYIDYYHQYWRFITPVFLHGSTVHIAFNMYSLYHVGPEMERFLGHRFYLFFYLICGFTGNVVSYIMSPLSVSVGASTALFGLFAGEMIFAYKNRELFPIAKKVYTNDAWMIAVNLLIGMQQRIDNWGHLGGLLGGALIALIAIPRFRVVFDPETGYRLQDSVSRKTRVLACILTILVFTILAILF